MSESEFFLIRVYEEMERGLQVREAIIAAKQKHPDLYERDRREFWSGVGLGTLRPRLKLEWDASPDLQTEFFGDFETYLAFVRAESSGCVGRGA